jgi:hypothetical protein
MEQLTQPLQKIVSDNNANKTPLDNAGDIDTVAKTQLQLLFVISKFLMPMINQMAERIVALEGIVGVPQAQQPMSPPMTPPVTPPMPTQGVPPNMGV